MDRSSRTIRQQFLYFFKSKGHAIVPSSSVVPHDDPTLLFTNAGMNQFKDVFLGTGKRPYARAADTQKCIRAGGKHNDLDDVGQDTYHHTFFEMLGNWSFGDYFKKEAIEWAWELLTKVWGIEKDRLHATYFEGDAAEGLEPDLESARLWRENTNIRPGNIHPGNKKDNFWEMGETGPCGPCTEIHIDLTPDRTGGSLVNKGDARVIEIWNLVFIQFNRGGDGKLTPLPARHVDTGMGLERVVAALQGKKSNYDTDVFSPIFEAIRQRTGAPPYTGLLPGSAKDPRVLVDISYRVIADHLRCLTFALTDGAAPSNEGRGYVLRRILRRAVRYGRQYLGMTEPFLCDLVEPMTAHMGDAFPELRTAQGGRNVENVREILRDEEAAFGRTLDRGIKLFNEAAEYARDHHHSRIKGADAFKLHDTYGFPIDLTEQMALERGLSVDIGEYERQMEEARRLAQQSGRPAFQSASPAVASALVDWGATDDAPKYDGLKCSATVLGWIMEDMPHTSGALAIGHKAALVLDRTSFYGEQGGQIGDTGVIQTATGVFTVMAAQRLGDTVLHVGEVAEGHIEARQRATSVVSDRRQRIMQNHTATHLLNWALRDVLGGHVEQKGSLVDDEKTRFDFSHPRHLSEEEIEHIQGRVAMQIDAEYPVYASEADQAEARRINTLRAVFGEKYPDRVRVIAIGAPVSDLLQNPQRPDWMNYSVEFCGGTHVANTREIGKFVLIDEEAVAKGVRRLVGVTGRKAAEAESAAVTLREEAGALFNADEAALGPRLAEIAHRVAEAAIPLLERVKIREQIEQLQRRLKEHEKAAKAASGEAVQEAVDAALASAPVIGGVTVIALEVPTATADALRGAIDHIRQKTAASAAVLASRDEGKVTLLVGLSREVVARGLKAGDIIRDISPLVGGKGGGRPDMAQGGGDRPEKIAEALAAAMKKIEQPLAG